MPSPYAQKYANAPKLRMPKEREGRKEAEGTAGLLRMLAGAAPVVGTGIGALVGGLAGGVPTLGAGAFPGAAAGAGIGGALGNAASSALGGVADEQERPYADDDIERESRRRLAMDIYGSLRR